MGVGVWNSNHLSGTAEDLCANQLPWMRRTMPQHQVEAADRGLALFEGTVFWGRRWNRVDEMHSQMGGHRQRRGFTSSPTG